MRKGKGVLKKILLGLAAGFVALQFFRPAKNDTPPSPDDLIVKYAPPAEVKQILEVACYDCHSNRTRYPWYAQIQPTGWWLASHINDGKGQMNLSEFGALTPRGQVKKLQAIVDEASDRSMPLKSYTWIHRDAKLTEAQIKTLSDWADALAEKLAP